MHKHAQVVDSVIIEYERLDTQALYYNSYDFERGDYGLRPSTHQTRASTHDYFEVADMHECLLYPATRTYPYGG